MNSFIRSYIVLTLNVDNFDEMMRKYVIEYKKKIEEYDVRRLLKTFTTTNRVRCIRINRKSSFHYSFGNPIKLISSRFNKSQHHFSQIREMRITLGSSIRDMTYDYYLKESKSMCGIKSNEITARNVKHKIFLNRMTLHTLFRKYSHIPY